MARISCSTIAIFLELIRHDCTALIGLRPTWPKLLRLYIKHSGFKTVVRYRLASLLCKHKLSMLGWLYHARTIRFTGADINPYAEIGAGLVIHHPVGIVIGAGARIGQFCTILQGVTIGEVYFRAAHEYPVIADHVVLGAGAKVLGNAVIGEFAVVGANAVVLKDVPAEATVAGVPAVLIKYPNLSSKWAAVNSGSVDT